MATTAKRAPRKAATNGASLTPINPTELAPIAPIEIKSISFGLIDIEIKGQTPLIQLKMSEKARQQMLGKQMGQTRTKKAPKDPAADYLAAMHKMEDDGSPGHPAAAYKGATVDAARFFEGLTFEDLKRCIFIMGEGKEQLVRLNATPEMDESVQRNATGVADIRYRAKFWPWSAILTVKFNTVLLSADAVANLVDAGGQSSGVGEWRPSAKKSRNGSFGMYEVVESRSHEEKPKRKSPTRL